MYDSLILAKVGLYEAWWLAQFSAVSDTSQAIWRTGMPYTLSGSVIGF